ncbi:MAG: acyl carrier protein [Rhizobiaceae bacterium]|jgi:acyl carrier protein|nr:acyl carrier protein [Rhizobiaceae bacterium]
MTRLRNLITAKLAERGHRSVSDTDSLFTSGRLDSMAAVEVMMMLEAEFGIDLSDADFDISMLDTIRDLEALLDQRKAA